MSAGRHRAEPLRHGRRVADPARLPSANGASFRRSLVASSAAVAMAGLSISMLLPANAAVLYGADHSHRTVSTRVFTPIAQSYSVPETVAVEPSVDRDAYTATPVAVLAAREAAAKNFKTKDSAIAEILAAEVSVVTVNASTTPTTSGTTPAATGATSSTDPNAAPEATAAPDPNAAHESVTVTTSGTVSDRVKKATLDKASAKADEIVAAAVKYTGVVPYVHDGASPTKGFDCSGLVMYVYAQFGMKVPHDVDGIAALGTATTADKVQPGDLVVYPHQHIGIYLGDGYMVDAPNVGRDVEVQAVWGTPTYVHFTGV